MNPWVQGPVNFHSPRWFTVWRHRSYLHFFEVFLYTVLSMLIRRPYYIYYYSIKIKLKVGYYFTILHLNPRFFVIKCWEGEMWNIVTCSVWIFRSTINLISISNKQINWTNTKLFTLFYVLVMYVMTTRLKY